MSHLITAEVTINNRPVLERVLKDMNEKYTVSGETITLTGRVAYGNRISINTATGAVQMDAMGGHPELVNRIRQKVAVEEYKDSMLKQGFRIENVVESKGTVQVFVAA